MKQHKIIAYCVTNKLDQITEEDAKKLDTIHIAFGLISEGEVYWKRGDAAKAIRRLRDINSEIKIVLSIGGWGADGFSQAAATEEGRIKFAKSAIAILEEENLDGLDIDWEYPCIGDAGIASSKEDKENYTLLLKELRLQLDKFEDDKTLSCAVGALKEFLDATNMADVQKYLDYILLMTYDYYNVTKDKTGHHANLYGSKLDKEGPNASDIVQLFQEEGVPVSKMVMGVAFYGRGWDVCSHEHTGLSQKVIKDSHRSKKYSVLIDMLNNSEEGYKRYWDEDAKAAYLFNGKTFYTFEDEEALSYKASYVKEQGMYGIMYWEYSEDETHTLTSHLYHCLNN